jgi:hypothetical protein
MAFASLNQAIRLNGADSKRYSGDIKPYGSTYGKGGLNSLAIRQPRELGN